MEGWRSQCISPGMVEILVVNLQIRTAGFSTSASLREAFGRNDEVVVVHRKAGPSTSLRFAQDDRVEKIKMTDLKN